MAKKKRSPSRSVLKESAKRKRESKEDRLDTVLEVNKAAREATRIAKKEERELA